MLRYLEDAIRFAWAVRRKPLESFMAPVAVLEDGLLCRDGSLVTLFDVEGARSIWGGGELERFVELGSRRLNAAFLGQGHALQIMFERAPDGGAAVAEAVSERQARQAALLGLDLGDLFGERSRRLGSLLAGETCVVAVWSREKLLPRAVQSREEKELKAKLKDWLPKKQDSQCPVDVLESLPPRHEAIVATLGTLFRETGLVARQLSGGEAVRSIRRLLNGAETTPEGWLPFGPEDRCRARVTEPPELGEWPPALAPQLLVRDPVAKAGEVEIGLRSYAGLDMTLGPRRERPFSELMSRMVEAGLPFRFSMFVEGGGLESQGVVFSRVASEVLAFASQDSRHLRDAMRGLSDERGEERAVVRLRVGMLTWSNEGEGREVLRRRVGRLQQIAEGWGECTFTPMIGDQVEALVCSVPGFAFGATGEPAVAPLTAALGMMPVSRPASPATVRSDYLFRSEDGKPLGYSLEESGDYGLDLVYGLPGRGKSVLLGSLGLAFCLRSGRLELPYMAIVDIGPSSSGLISLIREALPADRRHEAVWAALQMTPEYAVNPCDTPLGCRYPLPADRDFLTNLLGMLLTPVGMQGVPDGVAQTIPPLIDGIYRMRADDRPGQEPQRYARGRDAEVDAALARRGLNLSEKPLWWEAVDLLFEAGELDAAARAQRYAVPTLRDCLTVIREAEVQSLVGDARYGTGQESVTSAVIRILNAQSGNWPVLFGPTVFDLRNARIAAVDLSALSPQGSPENDKQTAVMYLMARYALTRDWWTGEEMLGAVPEKYRAYHAVRVREVSEAPKTAVFDEFHRTLAAEAVRAQVDRDAREARKQRVKLILASQEFEDFEGGLTRRASGYWVLGGGAEKTEYERLKSLFGLGEAALEAVEYRLTGPGRNGAPALHILKDEGGRREQVLVNTVGPRELWALNTAPRDVALRKRVQERLGAAASRAALARMFPAGSAKERLDADIAELERRGLDKDAAEAGVVEKLAGEVARAALEARDGRDGMEDYGQ